ncbi:hypothetical protein [Streptomyces olivochromogenes]|nr:hypothetical protein [Streptomyces olivochromogenes]MCF3134403.1 hypothetical protein [Streptomyces olivochromogenes]
MDSTPGESVAMSELSVVECLCLGRDDAERDLADGLLRTGSRRRRPAAA